jgi:hypothetical protein
MNKAHATGIALLLGAAAVLGLVAATRTAGLGHDASSSAATQTRKAGTAFAWRAHRLDRIEAALRRSLRSRPPKLPPFPARQHTAAASPPVNASAPTAVAAPRVVYQRPPPIVVIKHRAHGDGHESVDGGEGGGGDD